MKRATAIGLSLGLGLILVGAIAYLALGRAPESPILPGAPAPPLSFPSAPDPGASGSGALTPTPSTSAAVSPVPGATTLPGDAAIAPPGAPPGAPPPASSPLTPEQFHELAAQTLQKLPTAASMREVTEEEAHGYPEPIAKAGPLLGRIAQAVQDQPAFKPEATDFYVKCTLDREVVTPVRALCYSHLLRDPKAPPADQLPAEVVRLAQLIPAE